MEKYYELNYYQKKCNFNAEERKNIYFNERVFSLIKIYCFDNFQKIQKQKN